MQAKFDSLREQIWKGAPAPGNRNGAGKRQAIQQGCTETKGGAGKHFVRKA